MSRSHWQHEMSITIKKNLLFRSKINQKEKKRLRTTVSLLLPAIILCFEDDDGDGDDGDDMDDACDDILIDT